MQKCLPQNTGNQVSRLIAVALQDMLLRLGEMAEIILFQKKSM